jgi:hypothetical protein
LKLELIPLFHSSGVWGKLKATNLLWSSPEPLTIHRNIIGPVIGGILAEPVAQFPRVFRLDSIWGNYPYLLPNLIVMIFLMLGFLLAIFYLNETHPQLTGQADWGTNLSKYLRAWQHIRFWRTQYARVEQEEALTNPPTNGEEYPEGSLELETLPSLVGNEVAQITPKPRQTPYTSQIIMQVLSVSVLAFHKVSSDIVIPIFLTTTSDGRMNKPLQPRRIFQYTGGFGMTSADIGIVLLTQAIAAIFVQLFVSSWIISRFGALKTYRAVLHTFPCLYLLTPFTVVLPKPFDLLSLLLDLWTKALLVGLGYNCSAIL